MQGRPLGSRLWGLGIPRVAVKPRGLQWLGLDQTLHPHGISALLPLTRTPPTVPSPPLHLLHYAFFLAFPATPILSNPFTSLLLFSFPSPLDLRTHQSLSQTLLPFPTTPALPSLTLSHPLSPCLLPAFPGVLPPLWRSSCLCLPSPSYPSPPFQPFPLLVSLTLSIPSLYPLLPPLSLSSQECGHQRGDHPAAATGCHRAAEQVQPGGTQRDVGWGEVHAVGWGRFAEWGRA